MKNYKIALIANHNSYSGREYASKLKKNSINFTYITIGDNSAKDSDEETRCNSLWNPEEHDEIVKDIIHINFNSLNDSKLLAFLSSNMFDVGIQGGTGILSKEVIKRFRIGILNFHPGDLPYYRGCSAPEWQLIEGMPVICTCHLVDCGIDTGPVLAKKDLGVNGLSYYEMRSKIYPKISDFIIEILMGIYAETYTSDSFKKQDESIALYHKYIGEERINKLKAKLDSK